MIGDKFATLYLVENSIKELVEMSKGAVQTQHQGTKRY